MRTSATGTRQALPRGFTLLEILVVVAIVGIVAVVAVVNLAPSSEETARREAGDVAMAIEHARDAAWFGGLPTSVTLADNRVREWKLANDMWSAEGQRETVMAGDVQVTGVTLDGQPMKGGDRLVFLSDGLATPFKVALSVRGLAWSVEGDAAGAVRLLRP